MEKLLGFRIDGVIDLDRPATVQHLSVPPLKASSHRCWLLRCLPAAQLRCYAAFPLHRYAATLPSLCTAPLLRRSAGALVLCYTAQPRRSAAVDGSTWNSLRCLMQINL
ncbi:unnamed protein product, partial [Iphiclides podalirius]